MKSNDDIPADEMLLAEALAAAMARGLRWTKLALFKTRDRRSTFVIDEATSCCALGGLVVAGRLQMDQANGLAGWNDIIDGENYRRIATGNDNTRQWSVHDDGDRGESLGWAFRCAMTEDR